MILFKEKYGTIEYDENTPAIVCSFIGFMPSATFRNFLDMGLKFLIEKKQGRDILWLSDTKKHQVQGEDDIKWVTENWNPRAHKAGVRHVAFVLPDNIFGESSVNNYKKNTAEKDKDKIQVAMFDSLENAKNWFKSVKSAKV